MKVLKCTTARNREMVSIIRLTCDRNQGIFPCPNADSTVVHRHPQQGKYAICGVVVEKRVAAYDVDSVLERGGAEHRPFGSVREIEG